MRALPYTAAYHLWRKGVRASCLSYSSLQTLLAPLKNRIDRNYSFQVHVDTYHSGHTIMEAFEPYLKKKK